MKYKYCAGITLYNPCKSDLKNVIHYAEYFERVFVYDNTEPSILFEYHDSRIVLLGNGENAGLGVACHQLCVKAKESGFDYVMLFDQDSYIEDSSLDVLIDFIENSNNNETIIAPRVLYNQEDKLVNTIGYEKISWCITSGSIINLAHYGNNLQFDEKYFIDRLDKDFCKQVIKNGQLIIRVNNAFLSQKLGERNISGYCEHKPFRHYYIARNRMYYNKKFGVNPIVTYLQIIKHCYSVIRHENEKMCKLRMICLGIKDFKLGRMGKKEDLI